MIITIISLILNAVIFILISFAIKDFWFYFIPATLLFLSLWLTIILYGYKNRAKKILELYPDLFSSDEITMFSNSPALFLAKRQFILYFSRIDAGAAAGHLLIGSSIYVFISFYFQNWMSLFICILVILYLIFFIRDSLWTGDEERDAINAISRYLRAKKINKKEVTREDMHILLSIYDSILNKLESI